MKPAQIFHQYIWIINTLRAYGKLTLEELNQKWIAYRVDVPINISSATKK